MERLIVKNFGPLKDVDIELNRINLFIGENGSGKSVLGKIVTIVTNAFYQKSEEIFQEFKKYNIDYIDRTTTILLINNKVNIFELKENKVIEYNQKVFTENDVVEVLSQILLALKIEENTPLIKKIKNYFSHETPIPTEHQKKIQKITEELIDFKKNKAIKKPLHYSQYIPAERNLISLFNKSLSTLVVADIPLPKFLLHFSSEFEKAGNELKELEFLNIKYVNGDGLDRHKVYFNNKDYLPLENSSSGIQSALPIYLTVKYFANRYHSIIIEEPEQNLFPKAQKETVEYIVGELGVENKLFMMTHSPYILTALNNLILANDVKEQKGVEALEGIIEENYCVPFEDVSAYSLIDGKSVNIMDKEDRIIGVNVIDSISDEVSETFDKLLAKLD